MSQGFINSSEDVKNLKTEELVALCEQIREEIISVTQKNGGHLSSNLGVVELTTALHFVFDFPKDKVIFDVGHQCYTHKILSGRKDRFHTIRCSGGLSGFPDSEESEFDAFGTGHAGTSISAGLGYCLARDKNEQNFTVINVVGDGSLVNGLNLEAVFSSEKKPKNYILILNDNGMSISKNGNGFYRFISKNTTKRSYLRSKKAIKKLFGNSFVTRGLVAIRDFIKRAFNKQNYFEQFGFKYVEVTDGNDVKGLVRTLQRIKKVAVNKAVFLHVHTVKGKGHRPAEEQADRYHGVVKSVDNGTAKFSTVIGEKINEIISRDKRVFAITAGMKDGTGLSVVEKENPSNFYDVGIAEEYAVTFASGMAKGGLKPIVCMYSTFLQRAYDQLLHDVCIQNLPVVFLIDRAGFNGEDGKTHQGLFDLSYLTHLPNMTVFAPSCTQEVKDCIEKALSLNSPVAIRYPKYQSETPILSSGDVSRWQEIEKGDKVTVLAVGPDCLNFAKNVAKEFNNKVQVFNARSIKPLDYDALQSITNRVVITIEENSLIGGFGSLINGYYSQSQVKVINLGVQDLFVAHATRKEQMQDNKVDYKTLYDTISKFC